MGSKKNAMWRVVVADQRSPRDGRFIEMIGHYNPQTEPSRIVIDRERLDHWLERGAEPTNTVRKLMRAQNSDMGAPAAPADVEAPGTEAAAGPAAAEADPAADGAAEAMAEVDGDPEAQAAPGDEEDEAPAQGDGAAGGDEESAAESS